MKTLLRIFLFILILNTNSLYAANDFYPGQVITGEIKKLGNSLTNILLPSGEWIVTATKKHNSYNRNVDIVLIKIKDNKLVALINIGSPRDLSDYGWYENDVCNDYDDQKSNYHVRDFSKNPMFGWIGYCQAIYHNNVDHSLWDGYEPAFNTWEYMEKNNIPYPNIFIHIDNFFASKRNMAEIFIAVNPDFAGISSKKGVNWDDSPWRVYNIKNNDEKKIYIEKAKNVANSIVNSSWKDFEKDRKKYIDLR